MNERVLILIMALVISIIVMSFILPLISDIGQKIEVFRELNVIHVAVR